MQLILTGVFLLFIYVIICSNIKGGDAKMQRIIAIQGQTTKVLTPEAFVSLSDKERVKFSHIEFVPPRIGSKGFGKFVAKFKDPIYT